MGQRMQVGFMGLGRMGSLMAANLAKAGFPLTVYNRTPSVAEEFVAGHGGSVAATPAELAASTDVLISMLADGDVLIETYSGPAGVLEGIRRGTMAVDMGTSGPRAVRTVRDLVGPAGGESGRCPGVGKHTCGRSRASS